MVSSSGTDDLTTQNDSTLSSVDDTSRPTRTCVTLTVLHHPDTLRVGNRAELIDLQRELPAMLSRMRPKFFASGSAHGYPLSHPRLSRKPAWLVRKGDAVLVSTSDPGIRLKVDGEDVSQSTSIPLDQIRSRGSLVELGGCVLLWLHSAPLVHSPMSQNGILGLTASMRGLQDTIARVAAQSMPVLIRGESGVGKELVARAIHQMGPRADAPWITVNMAAVPVSMAAAELFGHVKGAFTGAARDRQGWFEQAHGGTLFLDEIGETPLDIQPQLLRALDSGEIQPVGQTSRKVDVRLIAATDADLEALVRRGQFRRSLFHRLQTAVLEVPPLRERQVDIPLLLHHFLREHLSAFKSESLLHSTNLRRRPWLNIETVNALMRYHFPGNVRELRNICSQIAIHSHDRSNATMPPSVAAKVEQSLSLPPDVASPTTQGETVEPDPGRTSRLTDDAICEVLRRNHWNISKTARELDLSKNALTARIRSIPGLRLAGDLTPDEIHVGIARFGKDIKLLAGGLQVSTHGLRIRMRELGLR